MNTNNKTVSTGKWTEIQGEIRRMWSNLTSDDLEKTKGDLGAVVGLIQQKSGLSRDNAQTKLDDLVLRVESQGSTSTTDATNKASEYKTDMNPKAQDSKPATAAQK